MRDISNGTMASLSYRYKFVLAILAIMSFGSYLTLQSVLQTQQTGAAEINVSGRQRMLTQRIAFLVLNFQHLTVHSKDEYAIGKARQSIKFLERSIELMEKSHDGLINGSLSLNLSPPSSDVLRALYFGPVGHVNQDVRSFLRLAKAYLEAIASESDSNEQLRKFKAFDIETLLDDLIVVVSRYQLENETKTSSLSTYQTISLVASLIVLIASWLGVFRPMVRQISKNFETIFEQGNALCESEERFRSISDSASMAMIIAVDAEGMVISWNPAAERLFGYSANEMQSLPLTNIMPERFRDSHIKGFKNALTSHDYRMIGKTVELVGLHKLGHEFPIELSLGAWIKDGQKYFSGIIHDISERKNSEKTIRENEALFQNLTTQIPGVIYQFLLKPDGSSYFPYASKGMTDIYGVTPEQARKSAEPVFAVLHCDDLERVNESIMASGKTLTAWHDEYRVILPGSKEPSWREGFAMPERLDDGSTLWHGFITNVDHRRNIEESLKGKSKTVELLEKISVAINEAPDANEALQTCINLVCAHTGWPVGHVYEVSKSEGDLYPTKIWHLDNQEDFSTFRGVTEETRFALGKGLPGRVLMTGKPAWIKNVNMDDNFVRAKLVDDIGVKSGLAFPVLVGNEVSTVLEFFAKDEADPDQELLEVMAHVGTQIGRVIERERAQHELEKTRFQIIRRLGRAGEYRDNETGMHVLRMSKVCYLLAIASGLSESHAEQILNASPMHDVGKIGIPDNILLKNGKLDGNEWEIMKTHAEIGGDIIGDSDSGLIKMARLIALNHHEKWDGSGYPNGLKGEAIPIEGRIAAICDVFDALTSERPYKKAWSIEEGVTFINDQSEKHFDPELVRLFNELLPDILAVRDKYSDTDLRKVF